MDGNTWVSAGLECQNGPPWRSVDMNGAQTRTTRAAVLNVACDGPEGVRPACRANNRTLFDEESKRQKAKNQLLSWFL